MCSIQYSTVILFPSGVSPALDVTIRYQACAPCKLPAGPFRTREIWEHEQGGYHILRGFIFSRTILQTSLTLESLFYITYLDSNGIRGTLGTQHVPDQWLLQDFCHATVRVP